MPVQALRETCEPPVAAGRARGSLLRSPQGTFERFFFRQSILILGFERFFFRQSISGGGFHGWWKVDMVGALGALVLSQGSPAQALIIAAGTGNTTAPANGAPWNNIGALNDGGCVYLGNGWVLTAGHVYNDDPGQDPVFGTTSYLPDGTSYTIHVPNNPSVNADLVMFHLAVYAELPAVTVASTAGVQLDAGHGDRPGDWIP